MALIKTSKGIKIALTLLLIWAHKTIKIYFNRNKLKIIIVFEIKFF